MSARRRVTVLSPHFDDVPLSLGQSLRDGALAWCDVRVRVVFGATNWTNWMHPTPSRATAVSWWRTVEEELAARSFGYRFTRARWQEALLRRGIEHSDHLLSGEVDDVDLPLVDDVRRWLTDVLLGVGTGVRPELLLAPAGIGGHVDHHIVATAAAQLAGSVDTPIGFYEDRPYISHVDDDELSAQLSSLCSGMQRRAVSGPVTRSTQLRARCCYPSQIAPYFTDAMDRDRADGATEGVWFPAGRAPEWFR